MLIYIHIYILSVDDKIYIYNICIYIKKAKQKKNLVKKNPKYEIYILLGQTQIQRNTGGRKRWESGYKFSVWARKFILIQHLLAISEINTH